MAFRPVGRRSLDSFVLLSIVVVLSGAVAPYREAGPVGMACAGVVYAGIWSWAWFRDSPSWVRLRDGVVAMVSRTAPRLGSGLFPWGTSG